MTWELIRPGLAAIAVAAVAGCDFVLPPPAPPPAQADSAAPDIPDLGAMQGVSYSDFVAGEGAAYSPEALGLAAADRARVWRAMAVSRPAELIQGGGAEALVFRGCAAEGCAAGGAVVAIDVATGGAFVGVRDVGGADELAPNDRVEALLRLTTPSRDWDEGPGAAP